MFSFFLKNIFTDSSFIYGNIWAPFASRWMTIFAAPACAVHDLFENFMNFFCGFPLGFRNVRVASRRFTPVPFFPVSGKGGGRMDRARLLRTTCRQMRGLSRGDLRTLDGFSCVPEDGFGIFQKDSPAGVRRIPRFVRSKRGAPTLFPENSSASSRQGR